MRARRRTPPTSGGAWRAATSGSAEGRGVSGLPEAWSIICIGTNVAEVVQRMGETCVWFKYRSYR